MTSNAEPEQPSEIDDDSDLPPRSLPADAVITINGWIEDDNESARAFGQQLMIFTNEYSRYLDLSLLHRIVIAWDYRAALAEITQVEDQSGAVPTSNEFGEGAAMVVWTRHEGDLRASLVIQTSLVAGMFGDDPDYQRWCRQTYVHELIHVDDKCFLDRTYPGGAMSTFADDEKHGALIKIIEGAHNEYSATSRTALIEPTTGLHFLDMLIEVLRDFDAEMLRERKRYQRREIELDEFWPWAAERLRFLFQAQGYALGHFDAVMKDESVAGDLKGQFEAKMAVVDLSDLSWTIDEIRDGILPVVNQPAWESLRVLDALVATAEKLLARHGLYLSDRDGALWVDVPFRGIVDL